MQPPPLVPKSGAGFNPLGVAFGPPPGSREPVRPSLPGRKRECCKIVERHSHVYGHRRRNAELECSRDSRVRMYFPNLGEEVSKVLSIVDARQRAEALLLRALNRHDLSREVRLTAANAM